MSAREYFEGEAVAPRWQYVQFVGGPLAGVISCLPALRPVIDDQEIDGIPYAYLLEEHAGLSMYLYVTLPLAT